MQPEENIIVFSQDDKADEPNVVVEDIEESAAKESPLVVEDELVKEVCSPEDRLDAAIEAANVDSAKQV